jgi:hypothetical protein
MNPALPAEAVELASAAEKAFASLGGVDAARRAEAEPALRAGRIAQAVASLGADELDPREDLDTAAAGAELCRVAGRCALAYPLVGFLLGGFAVVGDERWRVDHGDLRAEWRVATIDGSAFMAVPSGPPLGSRLGPFVVDLAGESRSVGRAERDVCFALALTGWRLLGMAEKALELAADHVQSRVQFGQPLSSFQAVQFQLADAAVGIDGLRELARYSLWRLFADPEAALADALALRLHALDVARMVLRTSQQLHGAAGYCDEYDISILCRHAQADLRLPFGAERTAAELFAAVKSLGFESLFPQGRQRG